MGTKQIRLDEDVYAKIEDNKRDGETFSEAIERMIDDWSLAEFDMGMTDEEREEFRSAVKEIEATTRDNVDAMLDEMSDSPE